MRKLFGSFALLLALTTAAPIASTITAATASAPVAAATTVYVCANGKTVVYHGGKDCAALRRCTYEVKSLTTTQAQANGLRGCMKCY